jgi:HAD superfamily hydrolase (TIGR01549 family)
MLKAVMFDFGQTLVDSADGFRSAEKVAKDRLFKALFPDEPEDAWAPFLAQYRNIRKEFHQNFRFSRPAVWQAIYRRFHRTPDLKQLENWETDYWDQVKSNTVVFPEAAAVLTSLARTHQLALITNTQGQKTAGGHRIALFPGLEKFFQVIIVAGEAGILPKPHRQAFHVCLDKLGIAAQEALYVGDDFRIDVCGAAKAGIAPVWLKHRLVRRTWPDVQTDVPIIDDLRQLLALVEGKIDFIRPSTP